jgi:hypothetical protein
MSTIGRTQEVTVGKFNRGYAAEAIFAAAVYAAYASMEVKNADAENPDFTINPRIASFQSIREIVKKALKGGVSTSRRDAFGGVDTVSVSVGIDQNTESYLLNSNHDQIIDLYETIIAYVFDPSNASGPLRKSITDNIFRVFTNGQNDSVAVTADGTVGQTETKTDVSIKVNNRSVGKVSLKVTGGDQFAQVVGYGFGPMESLFSRLGVNLTQSRQSFGNAIASINKDKIFESRQSILETVGIQYENAARLVYAEAAKTLSRKLSNKQYRGGSLYNFLSYGLTRDERDVVLVKVGKGKVTERSAGMDLKKALEDTPMYAYLANTKNPTIMVEAEGGLKLFNIRLRVDASKVSNGRKLLIRQVIEAKDAFMTL